MGCGCKRRANDLAEPLDERGFHRTANAIRGLAETTDRIQKGVTRGLQRTIRVAPFNRPPVEAQPNEMDHPSMKGIRIRGNSKQAERIRSRLEAASTKTRRTVIRGSPRNSPE